MNYDPIIKEIKKRGFRELTGKDRKLFDEYYKDMNGYWASSICFTSMIAWHFNIQIYYKRYDNYLLCVALDGSSDRFLMLPLIGYYEQEAVTRIMTEAKIFFQNLGFSLIMTDISEWMLPYYQNVPGFDWLVENDRGLCDYIYQAKDFEAAMDTQETRYNYKYFIRKYQPETYELSPEYEEECAELCERVWCGCHTCEDCHYGCLKTTIRTTMQNFNQLNAKGILVRQEGRAIAYCVVTRLKGLAIYQFKKTERNYRGINEYIHKECYDRFLKGVEVINYTEDMGLEGLRKYKSKLAPYTLSPKYSIELKPNL